MNTIKIIEEYTGDFDLSEIDQIRDCNRYLNEISTAVDYGSGYLLITRTMHIYTTEKTFMRAFPQLMKHHPSKRTVIDLGKISTTIASELVAQATTKAAIRSSHLSNLKKSEEQRTQEYRLPIFLRIFKVMLPRAQREEYLADLFELNKDLKEVGAPKFEIFSTNLFHWVTIVYHGLFFKLTSYFYSSKKKVEE
ncbi:MAG: hypothetical protein AAF391_05965 [Bacteroidota bacterium]